MARRVFAAVCAAALIASISASAVLGGEITGNGKSLHLEGGGLHGRSACAFSGQEDDQFKAGGSKGVPGHAQSWGQIPKYGEFFSRTALTVAGFNPGIACNPTKAQPE